MGRLHRIVDTFVWTARKALAVIDAPEEQPRERAQEQRGVKGSCQEREGP